MKMQGKSFVEIILNFVLQDNLMKNNQKGRSINYKKNCVLVLFTFAHRHNNCVRHNDSVINMEPFFAFAFLFYSVFWGYSTCSKDPSQGIYDFWMEHRTDVTHQLSNCVFFLINFYNLKCFPSTRMKILPCEAGMAVLLTHPQDICIRGRAKVRVVAGAISVMGHVMTPQGSKTHDLFSPTTSSLLTITTCSAEKDKKVGGWPQCIRKN